MSATTLVILLTVYVVGAIPRSEGSAESGLFEGISGPVAAVFSSVAGFVLGLLWARKYILLVRLHAVTVPTAALFIALGVFLIIESLIRFDLIWRSRWLLPSLPAWCAVQLAERLVRRGGELEGTDE